MCFLHLITALILLTFITTPISAVVTYKDLEEHNVTWRTHDTCSVRSDFHSLKQYTCHCGSICSPFGKCCAYRRGRRQRQHRTICKPVNEKNGYPYFLVDYCKTSRSGYDTFEKMCREEWHEDDNLMSLVPVTSLSSNVTYKNYFCFRCNEETEKLLYWNIRLNADGDALVDDPGKDVALSYSKASKTWMADFGRRGNPIPVTLLMEIPAEIQTLRYRLCYVDEVSGCDAQCKFKNGNSVMFRNRHCALCNFAGLEEKRNSGTFEIHHRQKKPFSFTFLMDINRSDGDKVGLMQHCPDNETWDPFFEKCRALQCAIPEYTLKDGKCSPL